MATVKGDVHDIGKNIVGVVLGCNNYEVIDLGVMVPTDKILQTAIDEKVDMVGLSGLITPSLDEMVFVASEMERRGFKLPLLIGGATTSKQHTAVKIAPAYEKATVHVLDASRAVDVVSTLLNPNRAADFDVENRKKQAEIREQYASRARRPLLSYREARANAPKLEWTDVPAPSFTGRRFLDDEPLAEIAKYIDWTLFFSTWELKGSFPAILTHPKYGAAATELYEHAQELLGRIIESRLLRARGSYGFWPANSDGDDIILYADETRIERAAALQHAAAAGSDAQRAAESIAGRFRRAARRPAWPTTSARFAVTGGLGADELVKRYEKQHDDYRAIMVKALADRLAEAFAEYLHARVRREWGYGATEVADERRSDCGEISRHPAGVRLSRVPGSHGEDQAVRSARSRARRHQADRKLRDDAGGQRQRHLSQPSAGALLHARPHRAGSARRLRRTEATARGRDRSGGSRNMSRTGKRSLRQSTVDSGLSGLVDSHGPIWKSPSNVPTAASRSSCTSISAAGRRRSMSRTVPSAASRWKCWWKSKGDEECSVSVRRFDD